MADNDSPTARKDYEPRVVGDTWNIPLELASGDLLAVGVKVWCTVKKFEDDPDPGLLQADTETGNVVIDDSLHAHAVFTPQETVGCPPNRLLHIDWQIDANSGDVTTVVKGRQPTLDQQTTELP